MFGLTESPTPQEIPIPSVRGASYGHFLELHNALKLMIPVLAAVNHIYDAINRARKIVQIKWIKTDQLQPTDMTFSTHESKFLLSKRPAKMIDSNET